MTSNCFFLRLSSKQGDLGKFGLHLNLLNRNDSVEIHLFYEIPVICSMLHVFTSQQVLKMSHSTHPVSRRLPQLRPSREHH